MLELPHDTATLRDSTREPWHRPGKPELVKGWLVHRDEYTLARPGSFPASGRNSVPGPLRLSGGDWRPASSSALAKLLCLACSMMILRVWSELGHSQDVCVLRNKAFGTVLLLDGEATTGIVKVR